MNNKFLQFLGLTKKAGKLREGYNSCEDTLKRGKGKLIIISKDASDNTKDKFKSYSKKYNLSLIIACTKEEMGTILGRAEINVICVTDEKMSIKLIDLWKQEEMKAGGE